MILNSPLPPPMLMLASSFSGKVTIHIAVYLPTSGLDSDFVHELAVLEATIDNLLKKHPTATIFVREDAKEVQSSNTFVISFPSCPPISPIQLITTS